MFAALSLAGCASTVDISHEYRESDYTWALAPGTARVVGQAFLKTMGGDVKYCAGEEIRLWPDAPYTQAVARVTGEGKSLSHNHPESLQRYVRRTIGDGVGGFEFTNLPAGRYHVACYLQWSVGGGMYAQQTGGLAVAVVDVAQGETKKVIATAR